MKFFLFIILLFSLLFLNYSLELQNRHLIKNRQRSRLSSAIQVKRKIIERKMYDGRMCKQKFFYNDKEYSDCTRDRQPDGESPGKEWCIEEDGGFSFDLNNIANIVKNALGIKQNWGLCIPNLNYDLVRAECKKILTELSIQTRQIKEVYVGIHKDMIQTLKEFEEVKKSQQKLDQQLGQSENNLKTTLEQIEKLLNFQQQFEKVDNNINEKTNEIKELEAQKLLDNPYQAEGVFGYYEEELGDGLKVSFFDNEMFLGHPKQKYDKNIDYYLNNEPPMDGIPFENFSIKWQGLLKCPTSNYYRFHTLSTSPHKLVVQDQVVIRHFFDQKLDFLKSYRGN